MATTPSKRKAEGADYSGYVQGVSPLKQSKKNQPYFNAVLQQSGNDFKEVVIYNGNKHQKFIDASKQKSPVKLLNCSATPNLQDRSVMDVCFGRESSFSYVDKLSYKFRTYVPPSRSAEESGGKEMNISDISSCSSTEKLKVTGKVVCELTEEDINVRGSVKRLKKILVGDNSGCLVVALWSDLISKVEVGKSYSFSSVVVKFYDKIRYISTSPSSEIVEVEEVNFESKAHLRYSIGEVVGVQVDVNSKCGNCNSYIQLEDASASSSVKCSWCKMRVMRSAVCVEMKGNISIKTDDKCIIKVSVPDHMLCKFLDQLKVVDRDVDTIEESILVCGEIEVVDHQGQVIEIKLKS